jgi:transcriptional regulator with XRE-family HTH domain
MNQCQISKIEKNERKVLAQELLVIAQALEVPLETLLTQSSTNAN